MGINDNVPSGYDIHSSPWKINTHAIKNGKPRWTIYFYGPFPMAMLVITRTFSHHGLKNWPNMGSNRWRMAMFFPPSDATSGPQDASIESTPQLLVP